MCEFIIISAILDGKGFMKNLITGKYGEWLAIRYLKKKGYEILKRNYKTPIGEIDIIAKDRTWVVFIEVKTRKSDRFGQPFESIDKRKREKLIKTGLLYLKRLKDTPAVRFDIISISLTEKQKRIEHIKDAFEL